MNSNYCFKFESMAQLWTGICSLATFLKFNKFGPWSWEIFGSEVWIGMFMKIVQWEKDEVCNRLPTNHDSWDITFEGRLWSFTYFYNYYESYYIIWYYILYCKCIETMSGKGMNWPMQDGVYMDSSYKLYYPPGTRWSLYGLLI